MSSPKKTGKRKLQVESESKDERERKIARFHVMQWFKELTRHLPGYSGMSIQQIPKWLLEAGLGRTTGCKINAWRALAEEHERIDLQQMMQRLRGAAKEHLEKNHQVYKEKKKAEFARRLAEQDRKTEEQFAREEARMAVMQKIRQSLLATKATTACITEEKKQHKVDFQFVNGTPSTPFELEIKDLRFESFASIDRLCLAISSPCALTHENLMYLYDHKDARIEDVPDKKSPAFNGTYVLLHATGGLVAPMSLPVYFTVDEPRHSPFRYFEIVLAADDIPAVAY